MSDRPLAYHITFGTYGMRLHGDARGTVSRQQNEFGEPIIGRDTRWEALEEQTLRFEPVKLVLSQRMVIEALLPMICQRGGWLYHQGAAQPDHVHLLLSTSAEGKAVRSWLKRWLGQELSQRWKLPEGASWWAEGGSVKWVWEQKYLEAVDAYIERQRASHGR